MKAIEVKYLPCTNYKGARVKAQAEGGNSVTVSRYHEKLDQLEGLELSHQVAIMLCGKMGWPTELIGGSLKDSDVFVFKNQ